MQTFLIILSTLFNRLPNTVVSCYVANLLRLSILCDWFRPSSVPRNVGEKERRKHGFEYFLCFCFPQYCKEVVLKTIKILRLLLVSSLTSGWVAFFRPCFIYYYGFVSADLYSKQKYKQVNYILIISECLTPGRLLPPYPHH